MPNIGTFISHDFMSMRFGVRPAVSSGRVLAGLIAVSETHKGSILVIEDDASIRKLVRAVLAREGYAVEVAADGVEGVLKLGLADYDVIVLDLMMPHLDGFSFVQALNESAPETLERIIVTSAASPAVIKERLKGARLEVMTKPFDIQALIEKVAASIAARRPPEE